MEKVDEEKEKDIERLAELRAKRRLRSGWVGLGQEIIFIIIVVVGIIVVVTVASAVGLVAIVPAVLFSLLCWWLRRREIKHRRKLYLEFYEEELLKLKIGKGS
jgi:Flp pilus assembly protein TadB